MGYWGCGWGGGMREFAFQGKAKCTPVNTFILFAFKSALHIPPSTNVKPQSQAQESQLQCKDSCE